MSFSLKLFGGAILEGERGPLPAAALQRHRLALLALLAVARNRVLSREKLVAWLWPERSSESARHLLNQAVHVLRQALGPDAILSVGEDLQLDPRVVRCDVAEFDQAVSAGDLERALGLYSGPLLDGFFVDEAAEFQEWVDSERARLAGARGRVLEDLAVRAERSGAWAAAVEWWTTRAAHDPLDSRVVLRLMEAMERAGNRPGALQHAAAHQALVQAELGIPAVPEVAALAERLRRSAGVRAPELPVSSVEPVGAGSQGLATATAPGTPTSGQPAGRQGAPRLPVLTAAGVLTLIVAGGGVWLGGGDRSPPAVNADVDRIAEAVARELERRGRGDTLGQIARNRTTSIAAYELYLRGDDPALLRSDSGARRGAEYFRRALALDSNYAAAWAGLARLSFRTASSSPRLRAAARRETEAAVRRALALDDSLGEAHSLMGVMRVWAFDYEEAERHLLRAIELEPRDPRNHERLAAFYQFTGRPREGLAAANRSLAMDPLSPSANAEVARALLANGRCEEAIERVRPLMSLDPPLLRAFPIMAQCLARLGRYEEAIAVMQRLPPGRGAYEPKSLLGYLLARAGRRDEAAAIQTALREAYDRDSIGAYELAFVPAALGDRDEAFKWLELGVSDRSVGFYPGMAAGFYGPPFDDLRDDPRIEQLRERMGLQKR